MVAVIAGILGLAAFLLVGAWGAGTGLLVLAVAVLLLGGCVVVGAAVGAGHPARARWLMAAWTPALLLGLGVVGAAGIELAIQLTAGDGATDRTKAVYAAAGAVVVAIIAAVKDWVGRHRAPWLARGVICWRYRSLFPCLPQGYSAGRTAAEALAPVCGSASTPLRSGAEVQALLEKIKAALDAGEVAGGPNWTP